MAIRGNLESVSSMTITEFIRYPVGSRVVLLQQSSYTLQAQEVTGTHVL